MKSDVATLCLLAFALLSLARGSQANPIEKVLEMLSNLQAKVLGEGQTWSWIICIIAVGAAFCLGRLTERKQQGKPKATPKAKAKRKAKPKCEHAEFTCAGSNQHKSRKRCLACHEVFEITDAKVVDKGPGAIEAPI